MVEFVSLVTMKEQKEMNAESERASLIRELQQVEDLSLLLTLKTVLHFGLKKEGRISIEQYNYELEEAQNRIDSGEFIVHEEAIAQMKKWRTKEE